MSKKPLMLMILDGWGINADRNHNAVAQAKTPNLTSLLQQFPHAPILTSGMAVGLPEGQMGNSEVGHLNIGAGRVVYQDLTRISKSIADGDFFENPVLLDCIRAVKASGGRLHLAGLLSDGGVHSHNTHIYGLLELARRQGLTEVFVHCLLDGRDTPPQSGAEYLAQLEAEMGRIGVGRVATVMGRYWGMDRDNRWDRVERAYNGMVLGEGKPCSGSREAITASYAADVTDEFVEPAVVTMNGAPVGQVRDGDGLIFFNFRSDRAREITRALALDDCPGFQRRSRPRLAAYVCMTEYDATFGLPIAYAQESLANIFGEVISRAGLAQLRIAETEKYAHVTFFFNGGVEEPFPGEERCLIPSPREVATYDQKPEMSAYLVTDELLKRLDSGRYDVIILNFANCDMVGHTGNMEAAVKAVEVVDDCVGRLAAKVREKGGAALITADHGNADQMWDDETDSPHTAHTCNPVWLILVDDCRRGTTLREGGRLADLAPTMLALLGIPKPAEMTGEDLIAG